MGISIEQWRQRIGTFNQHWRCGLFLPQLRPSTKYLSLCIRVTLFLLLLAHGVESNPGPGSSNSSNLEQPVSSHIELQSYGRGRGRGRGAEGIGRQNRGTGRRDRYAVRDPFENERRGNRRITRSQSERMGQSSITSWLGVEQSSSQSHIVGTSSVSVNSLGSGRIGTGTTASTQVNETDDSEVDNESQPDRFCDIGRERDMNSGRDIRGLRDENRDDLQSTGDVKELLIDIRREMRYMNRKFDKLENTMTSLKQDNKTLKKQNKHLTKQVEELSSELQTVTELAKENERKNERLESQSRRENLKFFGIEESRKESWDESENKVRKYIAEGLNIDDTSIQIERAHRLGGSSTPRPIIVKFSFFKDKEKILRAYRQKKKAMRVNGVQRDNAGEANIVGQEEIAQSRDDNDIHSQVRVAEDFVERVATDRTKLFPFMQDCIREGKNAYLRYDKLVVDDIVHVYDREKKVPVALQPPDK